MSQSFPASQVGIWPRKNHLGTQHSVGLSTWCKHLILGPKLYSSHHSPLWRYSVCLSGPAFVKEKEKKGGAHCERFWIPESGKFSAVESGIWENFACGIQIPGIWNPEDQRIRNSTNDWNSESTFHWQRLESAIHGLEFSIYACLLGLIPLHGAKSFIALNWSYLLLLYFARVNFREFCTDFTYPWFSRTWGSRRIQQSSPKQLFAQKG